MATPRNIVAWNAMIVGYGDNSNSEAALECFHKCRAECAPNATTYGAALRACGSVMAVETGKGLHREIRMSHSRLGQDRSAVLATCLVDFYAKCGDMEEACLVFGSVPKQLRDSALWNALLAGYSQQGDCENALRVFRDMNGESAEGLVNSITFLFLLTACSHGGLSFVAKGEELFQKMRGVYGLRPGLEHFTCMVDMYGRANRFGEAVEVIRVMREEAGVEPDVVLWRTLLGACRKWKEVEVGKLAFESLVKLDKEVSAAYVLMAGIYGRAGKLSEQGEVSKRRKDVKAWKKPGQCWWTDDGGNVHSYVIGRKGHEHDLVVDKLDEVMKRIKECGYVAETMGSFSEEGGEDALCGHSEKLRGV